MTQKKLKTLDDIYSQHCSNLQDTDIFSGKKIPIAEVDNERYNGGRIFDERVTGRLFLVKFVIPFAKDMEQRIIACSQEMLRSRIGFLPAELSSQSAYTLGNLVEKISHEVDTSILTLFTLGNAGDSASTTNSSYYNFGKSKGSVGVTSRDNLVRYASLKELIENAAIGAELREALAIIHPAHQKILESYLGRKISMKTKPVFMCNMRMAIDYAAKGYYHLRNNPNIFPKIN